VGKEGIVARLGGEEFSVLMPGADAEAAGVMAERMLANIRERCCAELAPGSAITMSIGIAAERVSSLRDGAALRARSDEALYMAKRGGRNRVLLWAPGVRSLATPAAASAAIVSEPKWPAVRR
jgi:diguanylate cyclase (GGDEF)-like protein